MEASIKFGAIYYKSGKGNGTRLVGNLGVPLEVSSMVTNKKACSLVENDVREVFEARELSNPFHC